MTAITCHAKNPATCRYHGKPRNVSKPEPRKVEQAEDLFERALKNNPRIAAMEAQIVWTKKKREELRNRYEFLKPEVTAEYEPVVYGDSALVSYNDEYLSLEAKATPAELEALKNFTATGHKPINEFLMSPDVYAERFSSPEKHAEVVEKLKKDITSLDTVIAKAGVTEHSRTVYRVLTQDHTKHFTSAEEYADKCGFTEGKEVEFKNFSSTTIDPAFVTRYVGKDEEHSAVVLVISARKGAPVALTATAPDENQYTQDTEREILLPRNTKYKVTKITRAKFSHHDDWYEPVVPVTVYLEEV